MRPTTDLADLARTHLPPAMAQTWIGLLRPGIQLDTAADAPGPVVGHLGGDPELPLDQPWPEWPGKGPLTFIAAIDCAAVPAGVDPPLPSDGTLLFFYFDGQVDGGKAFVIFEDLESQAAARVLYVPEGTETNLYPVPDGISPYPDLPLHASVVDTAPQYENIVIRDTFPEATSANLDHPLCDDHFTIALDPGDNVCHQLGGHAIPIQRPVEFEVAYVALGGIDEHSPDLIAEARRWRLLAQIDTDIQATMTWGDGGMLYWLIRDDDLAERRFDRALFTWQCG